MRDKIRLWNDLVRDELFVVAIHALIALIAYHGWDGMGWHGMAWGTKSESSPQTMGDKIRQFTIDHGVQNQTVHHRPWGTKADSPP